MVRKSVVNPCWNSLIFQCVFLYVYIQCYQYSWYLAYANLLTYWLSYPKSRDAIASKNIYKYCPMLILPLPFFLLIPELDCAFINGINHLKEQLQNWCQKGFLEWLDFEQSNVYTSFHAVMVFSYKIKFFLKSLLAYNRKRNKSFLSRWLTFFHSFE